jgi:predicted RNase H-like HicB family nuclease
MIAVGQAGYSVGGLPGRCNVMPLKIIIEKHPDGYAAYPLGVKGVVVGEGDTYEEALADVKSAIQFHVETFGKEVLESGPPVLEGSKPSVQQTRLRVGPFLTPSRFPFPLRSTPPPQRS